MRILKFIAGLFLLVPCVAMTRVVVELIRSLQPSSYSHLPLPFYGLAIGFFLWIFLFLVLPRPTRTYIFAHELTHALWAALMGAKVSKLKVSKKGGSVKVSKDNFLITLAPYFFPFYTVCAIGAYYLVSLFWDPRAYEPFWLGLIGLTWAFHLTFTIAMLGQRQPDIKAHGRVFSYTVIYLFNTLGIGLWIVLVASPTLREFADLFNEEVLLVWGICRDHALNLWDAVRAKWMA